MATFTMELYKAIEFSPNGDIGLNEYPIWDEEYRPILNKKIIDHYYGREIGLETIDMFRFAMRRRMNEIMPLYIQIYETTVIAFDPLSTIDMKTVTSSLGVSSGEASSENNTKTKGDSKSRAVQSETPQNILRGSGDYATSAADSNSLTNQEADVNESTQTQGTEESESETRTSGYQGAPADIIQRYRDTLINVDLAIITELEDLFMGVWNNGDSYFRVFSKLPLGGH